MPIPSQWNQLRYCKKLDFSDNTENTINISRNSITLTVTAECSSNFEFVSQSNPIYRRPFEIEIIPRVSLNGFSNPSTEYIYPLGNSSNTMTVDIPANVESIGGEAFNGCTSLATVRIGTGMKEIGGEAFTRCYSLESVYCAALTPPDGGTHETIERPVFDYYFGEFDMEAWELIQPMPTTLYVPEEAIERYKDAEWWEKENVKKTATTRMVEGASISRLSSLCQRGQGQRMSGRMTALRCMCVTA